MKIASLAFTLAFVLFAWMLVTGYAWIKHEPFLGMDENQARTSTFISLGVLLLSGMTYFYIRKIARV